MTPQVVGPDAAGRLAAVHAEAFPRPWPAEAFAGLLRQSGVVALACGDDGFVLLRRVLDEAEVLTLAVRPSARRRGLGRTLMAGGAALMAGLGVAELRLEVADDNAAARALYTGLGFAAVGVRRGYYLRAAGIPLGDAVLMRLALNTPAG